jgi:voltage-gated potassium channel
MSRLRFVERRMERFMHEPPTIQNAVSVIVFATALVVVLAGFLMTLVDRAEYPNVWVAIWWALQTITTVGYGDVTPTHVSGRIVGVVLMLQGVAFIAVVTAVITSVFVARAAQVRDEEVAHDALSDRELMNRRFDELERKIDTLAAR